LGQRSETCQEVFHVFLTGLFHWKLDTTDTRTYSIKPEDYPRLPLFNPKSEGKCVYLNQVFWLALDDAFSWRSMSALSCDSVEDIETLAESQYPSVQATKSGAALKAVPKLSKHLVAYMEGLLAVSPYVNGPFDSRAKGVAEAVAAAALSDLNQLANEPYMAYLKRKLGGWYREAPRPARKQPAVDADEPAPAAGDQEEATEADAPSGGGDGRGFVLD
jgi:hypothetical protein